MSGPENVGKSEPGDWPVEEFTRNEGSVGQKRIVLWLRLRYIVPHLWNSWCMTLPKSR